jgi:hypothetical protein
VEGIWYSWAIDCVNWLFNVELDSISWLVRGAWPFQWEYRQDGISSLAFELRQVGLTPCPSVPVDAGSKGIGDSRYPTMLVMLAEDASMITNMLVMLSQDAVSDASTFQ